MDQRLNHFHLLSNNRSASLFIKEKEENVGTVVKEMEESPDPIPDDMIRSWLFFISGRVFQDPWHHCAPTEEKLSRKRIISWSGITFHLVLFSFFQEGA